MTPDPATAPTRFWQIGLPRRQDWMSSIVVFLVALPLCLGIAIAAGASPAAGLFSGIIGGIIVGLLAGCPLQVTGPAAGLVALVAEIVQEQGLQALGLIILLAGQIQIFAGIFKLGRWFRAVSPAVIQGMLAGIGVVILASQFHVMLDQLPKHGTLANLMAIPGTIGHAFSQPLGHPERIQHQLAAGIGVMTIGVILLWGLVPARIRVLPAPLVAVVAAVIAAALLNFPGKYVIVPTNLLEAVHWLPTLISPALLLKPGIWQMALAVAFIASAETLLTASAVDRMQQDAKTDYDREMIAQGIGNSLCGLIGGLPLTGVIVRSAANVHAGAKTRWSTMLHGCWIIVFSAIFPFVLDDIPICSLAAVLVYTGFRLVVWRTMRNLWRVGKGELFVYLLTLGGIVFEGLLEGVILGMIAATVKLLYDFSHLKITLEDGEPTTPDGMPTIRMRLNGGATFFSLPRLSSTLEALPPGRAVEIHIESLYYIDHACLEMLFNWETRYADTGGSLKLEWHQLADKYRSRQPIPDGEGNVVFMNALQGSGH